MTSRNLFFKNYFCTFEILWKHFSDGLNWQQCRWNGSASADLWKGHSVGGKMTHPPTDSSSSHPSEYFLNCSWGQLSKLQRTNFFFFLLVLSLPGHATCCLTTAFLSNTFLYLVWGHWAQCQCSESHRLVMRHTATVHWFRQLKGSTGTAIRSLTWGRDVGKIVWDKKRIKIFLFLSGSHSSVSHYI